jgi:hypothetical protein
MTFLKKLLPSSGPIVKNPDIHMLALVVTMERVLKEVCEESDIQ